MGRPRSEVERYPHEIALAQTTVAAVDICKEISMSAGFRTRNIVLVHGAFVDGSSWRAVHDILTADGYHVAVVQNPTLSLPGDVASTRRIIDEQDGPVVLVGHSYGGAV